MNKKFRNITWVVVAGVLAALFWLTSLPAGMPANAPVFPKSSLAIKRADGSKVPFAIEVAATQEQASYGLMFRRSLPEDSGMLFLFAPDQIITMWMKNTYIPLDMVFVRHDGVIVKVITHTQPFSLNSLSSDEAVRGVIEMGDGIAAKKGIKTGDLVLYPAFGTAP